MQNDPPFATMSPSMSIVLSLCFSIFYIASLYLISPADRRFRRNENGVMVRRMFAALLTCLIIYIFLNFLSGEKSNLNQWLGFRTNYRSFLNLVLLPTLLVLLIYLGQIVQWIFVYRTLKLFNFADNFFTWPLNEKLFGIRNYIIGPLTEEFVFRASILVIIYPKFSALAAIFVSPLFFGLAHFHHMLECIHDNSRLPIERQQAIFGIFLNHLLQFTYTYIFGIFSAFLFIRTGHFFPAFISHSLCNVMSLPEFRQLFDEDFGNRFNKYLILSTYFFGIFLFIKSLYIFTDMNLFYEYQSDFLYSQWLKSF